MGDADITTSKWRLVEVGRIVLFRAGPYQGRVAAIVEIIDHKRALVAGPASKKEMAVPRQAVHLNQCSLTSIVISNLPRGIRDGSLKKKWDAAEVDKKFENSQYAQARAKQQKRRALTDFERFKVMRMRKQARYEVKKAYAKIRGQEKA